MKTNLIVKGSKKHKAPKTSLGTVGKQIPDTNKSIRRNFLNGPLHFLVFTCISLIFCSFQIQAQTNKGTTIVNTGEKRHGDIHAVIIGISKYANYPSLQYADKDAIAFYKLLLSDAFGADSNKVVLLLNEKATQNRVDEALSNLIDQVKEGDRVFIYFSGHGGVEGLQTSRRGSLLTYESSKRSLLMTSYRIEDLNVKMGELATANKAEVYLITDACHAGKVEEAKYSGLSPVNEYIGRITYGTCFLSCAPDELSLEGEQWGGGRGLFSYHLVNGMAGMADADNDSIIDLNEISFYVKSHVKKEALPNDQNPVITGNEKALSKTSPKFLKLTEYKLPTLGEVALKNIPNKGYFEKYLSRMTEAQKYLYGRFLNSVHTEDTRVYFYELAASLATVAQIDIHDNGYEEEYLGQLSEAQKDLYNRFIAALDKTNADKNSTGYVDFTDASTYYDRLKASVIPDGFEVIIRRKLIASLQDRPQQLLDVIISGAQAFTFREQVCLMADNLKNSARLMRASHYLYNITMAKFYYFKSHCYQFDVNHENDADLKLLTIKAADSAIFYADNVSFFYNNRGNAKSDMQDYQGAISDFSRAIELDQHYATAWYNRGNAKSVMQDYLGAIPDYSIAIELSPKDATAWYNRGLAKYAMQDYNGAVADYSRAIEFDPNYAAAYQNLSSVYFIKKDYDSAIQISEIASKINNNDPGLLDNLGYYYMENDNYNKAIEKFNLCLKIVDNRVKIDATLGLALAYYYEKDKQNAKKYFDQAKQLKPALSKGMEGILELEKEGYSYSEKKKETLKIMFEELK